MAQAMTIQQPNDIAGGDARLTRTCQACTTLSDAACVIILVDLEHDESILEDGIFSACRRLSSLSSELIDHTDTSIR